MNNQMAANKIEELEKAKRGLELEVNFNKKRWEIETLAAREVNGLTSFVSTFLQYLQEHVSLIRP